MWVKVTNEKSQVLYIKRLAIFKSDSRGIQTHNLLIRSQKNLVFSRFQNFSETFANN